MSENNSSSTKKTSLPAEQRLRGGGKPIVFVTNRTMITLTIVTLVLLVVLKPNKEVMIGMLAEAQDPSIALAFLSVLKDSNSPSLQLDYITAVQNKKLSKLDITIDILTPVDRFNGSEWQQPVFTLYAETLLIKSFQTNHPRESASANKQLVIFLENKISEFSSATALILAMYALQAGYPDLAYKLQLHAGTTNHKELMNLARQSGLNNIAYKHALAAYKESPSLANLKTVLEISQQQGYFNEGLEVAKDHFEKFSKIKKCNKQCLQVLINYSQSANDLVFSTKVAMYKANISKNTSDWLQASSLSAAAGDLNQAVYCLNQVMSNDLSLKNNEALRQKIIVQLLNYMVWQSDLSGALLIVNKYIDSASDPKVVRQAISIALAESNITSAKKLLFILINSGEATLNEIKQWLNYSDRVDGARYTVKNLKEMRKNKNYNSADIRFLIETQMSRLYNLTGQQHKTVDLWEKQASSNNVLFFRRPQYKFEDLKNFIQAYIDINKPKEAIEIAGQYLLLSELKNSEFNDLQELANYVGDIKLLKKLQVAQLEKDSSQLSPYLLFATHDNENSSDQDNIWTYFFGLKNSENSTPNSELIVLSYLLNSAIKRKASQDVQKVKIELINIESKMPKEKTDNTEINFLSNIDHNNRKIIDGMYYQIAFYENDNIKARQLLLKLLLNDPTNKRYLIDAIWLAIATDDNKWLQQLSSILINNYRDDTNLYQIFSYSEQRLGNHQNALYWYQKNYQQGLASLSDKLSWAQLLEERGQQDKSYKIRLKVMQELRNNWQRPLPQYWKEITGGELSYRSLLNTFVSPAYAAQELNKALTYAVKKEDVASILSSQSRNGLQRIQYWQAMGLLNSGEMNETVQLALALARKDITGIKTLIYTGKKLSAIERSFALAEIGEDYAAWQLAEEQLNHKLGVQNKASLLQALANLHSQRSHGVKFEYLSKPNWGTEEAELTYYRPINNGNFKLKIATQKEISGELTSLDTYNATKTKFEWYSPLKLVTEMPVEFNYQLSLNKRFEQLNVGSNFQIAWRDDPRISYRLEADINTPANQSKKLNLFANKTGLKAIANWQITSRNLLSSGISYVAYETDFDEKIGHSQQINLRVNEQVMKRPNWQFYSQYEYHMNTVAKDPLISLQKSANTFSVLNPSEFLADKYHRISIGQAIMHGNVGEPGPEVKGTRYLLDTNLGWNFISKKLELSTNIGLGVRLFGGDELYFKGGWQSKDITGKESMTMNLGYFLDF